MRLNFTKSFSEMVLFLDENLFNRYWVKFIYGFCATYTKYFNQKIFVHGHIVS